MAFQTSGFAFQGAGEFAFQEGIAVVETQRPGTDGTHRRRKRHGDRDELISWELAEARQKRRIAAEQARLAEARKPAPRPQEAPQQAPDTGRIESLVLASTTAYMERIRLALEAEEQVRILADAIAAKRKERERIIVMMMMGLAS